MFGNVPQARDGVVTGGKRLASTSAQGDPADKAVGLVLAHRERGNADDVVNRIAHVGTVANTRSLPCGSYAAALPLPRRRPISDVIHGADRVNSSARNHSTASTRPTTHAVVPSEVKQMRPSPTGTIAAFVTTRPATGFTFDVGDFYWNRLAYDGFDYEPELRKLLELFRDIPFTFLDCGANFGFWSVLVASKGLGGHRVLAVEASPRTIEGLKRNVAAFATGAYVSP